MLAEMINDDANESCNYYGCQQRYRPRGGTTVNRGGVERGVGCPPTGTARGITGHGSRASERGMYRCHR